MKTILGFISVLMSVNTIKRVFAHTGFSYFKLIHNYRRILQLSSKKTYHYSRQQHFLNTLTSISQSLALDAWN